MSGKRTREHSARWLLVVALSEAFGALLRTEPADAQAVQTRPSDARGSDAGSSAAERGRSGSGSSTAGGATTGTSSADEEARALFLRGQAAYDAGRFAEAAELFDRAYALSGRPALLYNIYVARRDMGDVPGAVEALRRYLADDTTVSSEQRELLRNRLRAMEASLASRSTSGGGSATDTGGQATRSAPDAETGAAPAEARGSSAAPSSDAAAQDASARGGSSSGAGSGSRSGGDLATVGWVMIGATVVPVAAAVVFGVMAFDASAELDRECNRGPTGMDCPPTVDQDSIIGRFEVSRALGWVMVATAVLTAGTGLALVLAGSGGGGDSAHEAAAGAPASRRARLREGRPSGLRVAATPFEGGAALLVGGRF